MLTWTKQGGDCPALEPQLVALHDDGGKAGAGCTIHSDVWSDGDCKNQRTMTCTTRYVGGTSTNDAIAVTRQATQDGGRVDGTISMAIELSSGARCRGTYAVSYVRQ